MGKNNKISIVLGLIAALFFAATFVLNRLMSLEGGSWIWSSSFRFYFMVPFLFFIVSLRKGLSSLFKVLKKDLFSWILWSSIGFGVFYAPLTFAASYSPSWIVAGTWQFTIVAGLLLSPFLTRDNIKIPKKSLLFSLIILVGIAFMQINQATNLELKDLLMGIIPVIIAAFAYPLGNRKMMIVTNGELDVFQRTLGMTLASLPFWIILTIIGIFTSEPPSSGQLINTLTIALSSGIIATLLFFKATDLSRNDQKLLASVEATQSAEVVFALIGEIIFLNGCLPDIFSLLGILLIIIGMTLHSLKHLQV